MFLCQLLEIGVHTTSQIHLLSMSSKLAQSGQSNLTSFYEGLLPLFVCLVSDSATCTPMYLRLLFWKSLPRIRHQTQSGVFISPRPPSIGLAYNNPSVVDEDRYKHSFVALRIPLSHSVSSAFF